MASLSNDGGRRWRIMLGSEGGRKTIRFRGSPADAQTLKDRVELLALAQEQGKEPSADLTRWLGKLPDKLHKRLVKAGIARERTDRPRVTLRQLLDTYFEHLDVKPITRIGYITVRNALEQHFGAETDIATITPLAAKAWRTKLKQDGTAQATISKRISVSRHIFKTAIELEWLIKNPFASVVAGSQENKARQFFITRDMADKVMEKCPTLEWKLIFALSRYGGLRCPSEHSNLKWSDVHWGEGKFRVTCTKTEGRGKSERWVPIFPELEPLLTAALAAAPEGTEAILPRITDPTTNLRTTFTKIVRRAGLEPWERLFHNLRSSRQTELSERFPQHVVCSWLGNTVEVAQNHYLQVTEGHWIAAGQASTPSGENKSVAESVAAPGDLGEVACGVGEGGNENTTGKASQSNQCRNLETTSIAAGGLAFPRKSRGIPEVAGETSQIPPQVDSDLATIIDAWPRVPAEVRRRLAQEASDAAKGTTTHTHAPPHPPSA